MKSLPWVVLLVVVLAVQARFKPALDRIFTEPNPFLFELGKSDRPDQDESGVCNLPWHTIPGGGSRCYLFSHELAGNPVATISGAKSICNRYAQLGVLACLGQDPALATDPLLEYLHKNRYADTWIGYYQSNGEWTCSDRSILTQGSDLWYPYQPSGDGQHVEVLNYKWGYRAYLNDLPEKYERGFACMILSANENKG